MSKKLYDYTCNEIRLVCEGVALGHPALRGTTYKVASAAGGCGNYQDKEWHVCVVIDGNNYRYRWQASISEATTGNLAERTLLPILDKYYNPPKEETPVIKLPRLDLIDE